MVAGCAGVGCPVILTRLRFKDEMIVTDYMGGMNCL
jgi:hypothetical protein